MAVGDVVNDLGMNGWCRGCLGKIFIDRACVVVVCYVGVEGVRRADLPGMYQVGDQQLMVHNHSIIVTVSYDVFQKLLGWLFDHTLALRYTYPTSCVHVCTFSHTHTLSLSLTHSSPSLS